MEKFNIIVLDTNNLFWRCFYFALQNFIDQKEGSDNVYIRTIEIAIQTVNKLIEKFGYKSCIFYFLCDNPVSKINLRKIISNGAYKHHRTEKKISKQFYYSLNIFIHLMKCYSNNYRIVKIDGYEADDLTKPLKELEKDKSILFVSSDLDWARNIDKNCIWSNWKDLYNQEKFFKKFGYKATEESIKLYKAIHGDSSDNIPNAIPYLPKSILLDIINKNKNIDIFFKNLNNNKYKKEWINKIKNAERMIRTNYLLVNFLPLEESFEQNIRFCKENIKELKFWFEILGIQEESRMIKERKNFFTKKKIRML